MIKQHDAQQALVKQIQTPRLPYFMPENLSMRNKLGVSALIGLAVYHLGNSALRTVACIKTLRRRCKNRS